VALGREAKRGAARAGKSGPTVNERIEHEVEELALHLEADLLRAGRCFAGDLRERVAEIGASEPEDGDETGRQRAAVVEEIVERARGILLVLPQPHALSENGGEVHHHVGRGVAQRWREAGGQIGRGQGAEGAAVEPARRGENTVTTREALREK